MAKTQFMIRLDDRALERLEQIATEHGFTGGRGRHGRDEPNKAEAARYLLGQADEKIFGILYAEEAGAEVEEYEPAEGCPDCGKDTVAADVHDDGYEGRYCTACGWRE